MAIQHVLAGDQCKTTLRRPTFTGCLQAVNEAMLLYSEADSDGWTWETDRGLCPKCSPAESKSN